MHPIVELGERDEDRRDVADDVSDVRDDSKKRESEANQKPELQTENRESDGQQQTVDQRYNKLAAEKVDKVTVDFSQYTDHFVFEFRAPERQVIAPLARDSGALFQKEKQINRNDQQA